MNKAFTPLLLLSVLSLIVIGELLFITGRVFQANEKLVGETAGVADVSEPNQPHYIPDYDPDTLPKAGHMLFVGDIMLGRNVETLMDANGADYPFRNIQDVLRTYPEVIANLEGPILFNHQKTPNHTFHFSFSESVAETIRRFHITTVSLANNHTYDFGVSGFAETETILDRADIAHVGNPFVIREQFVFKKKIAGQTFVFLGFNATNPHIDYSAALALATKERLENPKAILVSLIHWGDEYSLTSNTLQQKFAHSLIDQGVDVIVGHHPHVVEEVEVYKDAPIFYSLGNFIFDQYFSKDVEEGLAFDLEFVGNNHNKMIFTLIPIQSVHSQPAIMQSPAKELFLADLAARSGNDAKSSVGTGILTIDRK